MHSVVYAYSPVILSPNPNTRRHMRHSLVRAVIGIGLLSLTGCQPVASPLYGWIYNDTKYGDFATTDANTTKEGKACATTILGAWATGDASVEAAKADGKITEVSS